MSSDKYDPQDLENILPIYYSRFFPFNQYYKWLSYGNVDKSYFSKREFSFTLKDDVYIRYMSFNTEKEMETEIKNTIPHKIDIGAVYSCAPKGNRHLDIFEAVEKEVVIDIDITDYDDVRTCCSGGDICKLCWPLMAMAVKILDVSFREDFGYEQLLWVFSGRRGIHCWICDAEARKLSSKARSAIIGYLSLVKGGAYQQKKVHLTKRCAELKPWITRSLNIIDEYFTKVMLEDQNILETKEQCINICKLAFEDNAKAQEDTLAQLLKCQSNSVKRWEMLERCVASTTNAKQTFPHPLEEIKIQYCFPRLDINVTKGINHLLKGPFCVHPKTGQIAIPFDPKLVDDLDPTNVVKVSELFVEADAYDKEHSSSEDSSNVKDYQKTSLKSVYKVFQEFLNKLESSWKEKLQEQKDMSMEF